MPYCVFVVTHTRTLCAGETRARYPGIVRVLHALPLFFSLCVLLSILCNTMGHVMLSRPLHVWSERGICCRALHQFLSFVSRIAYV